MASNIQGLVRRTANGHHAARFDSVYPDGHPPIVQRGPKVVAKTKRMQRTIVPTIIRAHDISIGVGLISAEYDRSTHPICQKRSYPSVLLEEHSGLRRWIHISRDDRSQERPVEAASAGAPEKKTTLVADTHRTVSIGNHRIVRNADC